MSGSFPHLGGQQPADARRPGAWERLEIVLVLVSVRVFDTAGNHPLESGDALAGLLPGLVAKVVRRGVGGCAVLAVAGAGGSGAGVAGTRGRWRVVVEQAEGTGGEALVAAYGLIGVEDRGVEQDVVVEC